MNGKLWFRAKQYGWGWYPVTWQGWSVLVLYIVALFAATYCIDAGVVSTPRSVLSFGIIITVLTVFLIIICYATGETPKWRWGNTEITPKKEIENGNGN
jgi:hypothetical protein